jgi:hypothetical protein
VLASFLAAGAMAHPAYEATTAPIRLRGSLPGVVRIAQRVTVTGRVREPSRGARVELELERTVRWRVVASTGVPANGGFSLRWKVQTRIEIGPVKLRLILQARGRPVTSTAPVQSAVGSAAVYCRPPVPPAVNLPAGDGWIGGGVYTQGGPFPGIYACASAAYTITATNAGGAVVASQTFPALRSYTLVLPAGSYMLASGACRGMATVTAGRETKADTDCDFP